METNIQPQSLDLNNLNKENFNPEVEELRHMFKVIISEINELVKSCHPDYFWIF